MCYAHSASGCLRSRACNHLEHCTLREYGLEVDDLIDIGHHDPLPGICVPPRAGGCHLVRVHNSIIVGSVPLARMDLRKTADDEVCGESGRRVGEGVYAAVPEDYPIIRSRGLDHEGSADASEGPGTVWLVITLWMREAMSMFSLSARRITGSAQRKTSQSRCGTWRIRASERRWQRALRRVHHVGSLRPLATSKVIGSSPPATCSF